MSLLLLLVVAAVGYQLLALGALARFVKSSLPAAIGPTCPGVTLLKPVKGCDQDTRDCLSSFLKQDYAPLQVLFGVAEAGDPVIPLLQELQAQYPQAAVEIVVCGEALGLNPKVSTLRQLEPRARYEYLVISDSDIRVAPDYLRHVVAALQEPGVGLVTCPYRAGRVRTIGAALEALTISADFIPSVAVAYYVEGIRFALGATMALPHRLLPEIGGLESLADYLADDYQIGYKVAQAGYQVRLLPYVVETLGSQESFRGYLAHQLRWARTYRICRPKGYFAYGITHALPFALFTWLSSGLAWWAGGLVCGVALLRGLLAYRAERRYLSGTLPWPYFALLPVKDLFSFGLWLLSFLGDRVIWQGEAYRLTPAGKLVKISAR